MLFSIVVPIYNVEPYLERCIASLREQTYKDIEIILVDDESPDNCPALCDRYADLDDRIHVVHKKNGGLSDARNHGLAAATGEYIIFLDSDDYIALDTCEKFAQFTSSGADMLVGNAIVEGGACDLTQIAQSDMVTTGQEYLKQAYSQGKAHMAAWLNVYRRQFLLENGLEFKKGILHEDEQFTPRAFLKANAVINTGVTFYHYIIRENSITTKKDKRRNARDLYATCCELETIYNQLADTQLRDMLLDSLAVKYLFMMQTGKLHRYPEYHHKAFIKKNAKRKTTKLKAMLYGVSPAIYYHVNYFCKKAKG